MIVEAEEMKAPLRTRNRKRRTGVGDGRKSLTATNLTEIAARERTAPIEVFMRSWTAQAVYASRHEQGHTHGS